MTEQQKSQLRIQLGEVLGDLEFDTGELSERVPEDVWDQFMAITREFIASVDVKAPDGGTSEALFVLSSALVWMFLAGREHMKRGYPLPSQRTGMDAAPPTIPDGLTGLSLDDGAADGRSEQRTDMEDGRDAGT